MGAGCAFLQKLSTPTSATLLFTAADTTYMRFFFPQKTSAEGVFALGDVTGRVELTPMAIAAGRRLADRLFAGVKDAKVRGWDGRLFWSTGSSTFLLSST